MDLGSVRYVHAIVVQGGSLEHSFSGWVTKLRVSYSIEEKPVHWVELREVLTGCSSNPMVDNCANL